ncbi:NAD(P)-dependent alcohol dehydrogenase [Mycetocola manganoxydans]|uniref:NAD(P)-dependent alcohol dehydrogenase n=1 Tax=Mycetocola manganoxydans TaxID=699879 RepID=A0A3L6ZQN1_9MICO|nr:NAD(P)-dependent alcohol dehydrogenase [Mycetocola manganoxydans]RLP70243.1 NAD(P)-dependent alcohol dehydrogenase [Mycetocola manganoxydans]GHD49491.1 NADPH:quinone reductase [Mycetocola manganoxydans]
MRAIIQHRYGAPDVLAVEHVDQPEIGDDDVLVRVAAAGVDAGVWHTVAGKPYLLRLFGFGFRAPKQKTPGRDVAGHVTQVGSNVTRFALGDEVFGTTLEGSFAEFTRVPAERLALKPANVSFEQAAVTPISGCTALHGLRDAGRLAAGQRVLVLGAGGGVGSFAVQIAVAMGASVTGVCSTDKVEFVRSLGAAQVIDRTREDFAAGPGGYDLILDTAGHNSLRRLRRMLSRRGTLVIVGGEGGGPLLGGFGRSLRALVVSAFVPQRLVGLMSEEDLPTLEALAALVAHGSVVPPVDRVFPLERAGDAIEYLHAGRPLGKVVVKV